MQNHQSALDSQREDNAIQDLEDAGIYPVPDNDAIMEDVYEDVLANHPEMSVVNSTIFFLVIFLLLFIFASCFSPMTVFTY